MRFPGFANADFDTFLIPGLEPRMDALKAGPRPKLELLGSLLAPELTQLTARPIYPHIARHARRKVNPPADTWVALSANRRGYKMAPHFQVGMWAGHAFIQAGVIYEAEGRSEIAASLLANLASIRAAIPGHFRWLEDYTNPEGRRHSDMSEADFAGLASRLTTRKQADAMVGLSIPRDEVVAMGPDFLDLSLQVCQTLLPIYMLGAMPVSRA